MIDQAHSIWTKKEASMDEMPKGGGKKPDQPRPVVPAKDRDMPEVQ